MIPFPVLGIRFDLRKIDNSDRADACWKLLWNALDGDELGAVDLFEAAAGEANDGDDPVLCIAIHGTEAQLGRAAEALGGNEAFRRVAAAPAFVWDGELAAEPLVPAARAARAMPRPAAASVPQAATPVPTPLVATPVQPPPAAGTFPTAGPAKGEPSPTSVPAGGGGRPRRRIVVAGVVAVAMVALVVAAVALPRATEAQTPAEVILTGSDAQEIAAAVDEIAEAADVEALRRLIDEAATRPDVAAHLASIRDRLTGRLASGPAEERVRILDALAVFDDEVSATVLVDSIRFDEDPAVHAAAVRSVAGLDRSLGSAIDLLVDARSSGTTDPAEEARIEEALREMGAPAAEAIEALPVTSPWAVDLLISMGRPPVAQVEEMISSRRFGDLRTASEMLLAIDRSHGDLARPLWRRLAARLRSAVTGNARRAQEIAEIAENVARVRPALARPVQKRLVQALIPKLDGRKLAISEALARIGKPAVGPLIPIARQGFGLFVSQDVINRADGARQALISMISHNRKALRPLVSALQRRDYRLIADLMLFYIHLGKRGTEGVLLEAQERHGDTLTAIHLLESGNRKLDRGVRAWATRNGYSITGSPLGLKTWGAG